MPRGISFPHRHPHERVHIGPLLDRLHDVAVAPFENPAVVVHCDTRPPVRGAWNVQVFHGLGDKAYVCNPIFLQRGRFPRLRTALNIPLARLHLPAPFLRPPRKTVRRASRYQELNAYGPRFADIFRDQLKDAFIARFGHVALNERDGIHHEREGPVVWMPTWDNRAYLGGPNQSSLPALAQEVMRLARQVPVLLKYHPLTLKHGHEAKLRRRLEQAPGIQVAPAEMAPYDLLQSARGLLTDTSSLGFEAYCSGLPVALADNPRLHLGGLHDELAQRVPAVSPNKPDLEEWALDPEPPGDGEWARDLMDTPRKSRNDDFAAHLRKQAVERLHR